MHVEVKTVDNQSAVSPVTCNVCEEIIIDGKDSTVLCEGFAMAGSINIVLDCLLLILML